MVLCAKDVTTIYDAFSRATPWGNPSFPAGTDASFAYVKGEHWEVLGQLRCQDDIFLRNNDCYFGLVLKSTAAQGPLLPGDILIAIKGTSNPAEWMVDFTSVFQTPAQAQGPGDVAVGFWALYSSMHLADFSDSSSNRRPATGALKSVIEGSTGRVFITGHSLGAALATYLTYDLSQQLNATSVGRLQPYFFASPKTGTLSHVQNYQIKVPSYNLANYSNDWVPKLPFEIEGYRALQAGGAMHNVHTLRPGGQSWIPLPLDVGGNHSAVLYARLLDPNNPIAAAMPI